MQDAYAKQVDDETDVALASALDLGADAAPLRRPELWAFVVDGIVSLDLAGMPMADGEFGAPHALGPGAGVALAIRAGAVHHCTALEEANGKRRRQLIGVAAVNKHAVIHAFVKRLLRIRGSGAAAARVVSPEPTASVLPGRPARRPAQCPRDRNALFSDDEVSEVEESDEEPSDDDESDDGARPQGGGGACASRGGGSCAAAASDGDEWRTDDPNIGQRIVGKLWQSAAGDMIVTAPEEPESPREGFSDMHCELDLKVVAWAECKDYAGTHAGRLYQVQETGLNGTMHEVDESTVFLGRIRAEDRS